jgi:DNA-binding transcriptional regulator YiaG
LAILEQATREELVRLRTHALPSPNERRAIRERASIGLRELAEVLGVPAATLHDWEQGRRNPRRAGRLRYVAALRVLQGEEDE